MLGSKASSMEGQPFNLFKSVLGETILTHCEGFCTQHGSAYLESKQLGRRDKMITSLGQPGVTQQEKKKERKKLLTWNKDKIIWLIVSEATTVDTGYVGL